MRPSRIRTQRSSIFFRTTVWGGRRPPSSVTTIAAGGHIGISAISLAEMIYLIEKERIPGTALDDVIAAINDPKNVLKDIALDERIAVKMRNVPPQDIPDLPDGIIAATALILEVPVLSPGRTNSRVQHQNDLVVKGSGTRHRLFAVTPETDGAKALYSPPRAMNGAVLASALSGGHVPQKDMTAALRSDGRPAPLSPPPWRSLQTKAATMTKASQNRRASLQT